MVDIKEKYKDLQPLPCGIQDFEKIRTNGLLYADKTEYVYKLANDPNGEVYFLGRPRRFGKSLFLSTLECYFNARKDLFEGLKVMELEQKWTKYEVLRFDLSGCSTIEELKDKISNSLRHYENRYNYEAIDKTLAARFITLIHTAAKEEQQRVVVLFDEYDSALQQTMYNEEEHEKMRDFYRSFFAVLKSESHYIFKIFLTGIMKFTQLSLFSVLNNISIISADDEYAGVCGFSHEDLQTYFKRHVERLADASEMTYDQAYQAILDRYDSYSFSQSMLKVINPFSFLNAIKDCKLGNYWVTSGATKVLMDTIDSGEHQIPNWDWEYLDMNTLERNDADKDNLVLSLYQTGYLTIKEYNKDLEETEKITYTDIVGIMMSSVSTIVDVISKVLIAFVSISLIVSCIMIAIITYISVIERTKEIGILRAIGASKRNISSIFNAETFIIGLLSGILGIGISYALIPLINLILHHYTGNIPLSASLAIKTALILVVLSIILTLIGGLIPAKKASKKDPVEALRTE